METCQLLAAPCISSKEGHKRTLLEACFKYVKVRHAIKNCFILQTAAKTMPRIDDRTLRNQLPHLAMRR